jgi:glycosyl transferase family 25
VIAASPDVKFGIRLINLDRSPDRLARARSLLDGEGLTWSRLPAADGNSLAPAERAAIDEKAFMRRMGRPFRAGEAGCTFSHLRALRALLESDDTHALILEDDFVFPAGGPAPAARIAAVLGAAGEWDLLKAYTFRTYGYFTAHDLGDAGRIVRPLNRITKSLGHFVNRRAAEAILSAFTRFDEPLDWFLDSPWRFGLKYRALRPNLVEEAPHVASTIGYNKADIGHLPLFRQGGALAHRIAMGTRRTINNFTAR